MKVAIKDGDTRIVRYGVADFDVNQSDGTVTLFYSPTTASIADAPYEEPLTGVVVGAVDSAFDNDPAYREEDLIDEEERADDLKDYRST